MFVTNFASPVFTSLYVISVIGVDLSPSSMNQSAAASFWAHVYNNTLGYSMPGYISTPEDNNMSSSNITTGYMIDYNSTSDYNNMSSSNNTPGYNTMSGYSNTPGYNSTRDYNRTPGYSSTLGYINTPSYNNTPGYSNTLGYSPTSSYNSTPGYSNTSSYSNTKSYSNKSGYSSTSGYSNTPNYSNTSGYSNTPSYSNMPGYSNTPSYNSTPGYSNTQSYSKTPDYSSTPSYSNTPNYSTPGFSNTSGYSTTTSYSNTSGYSTTTSYSNTSSYSSTPSYSNTSGYSTTTSYSNTPEYSNMPEYSNTQEYSNMPSYSNTPDFNNTSSYSSTQGYSKTPNYNSAQGYSSTPDYNNSSSYSSTQGYSKTPNYNSMPGYSNTQEYSNVPGYSNTQDYNNTSGYSSTPDYKSTPGYSSTSDYNIRPDYNIGPNYYFHNETEEIKPFLLVALALCPNVNFCTVKQNLSIEEGSSASSDVEIIEKNENFELLSSNNTSPTPYCCEHCSCLPTCSAGMKCCPDAAEIYPAEVSLSRCYTVYHVRHVDPAQSKKKLRNFFYETIVSCEGSTEYEFGRRVRTAASFEDVVRVSVENRLYYNKEVATCRGETQFTRWELIAIACVDDLYSLTLQGSKLEKYVLKNCTVYSEPPDHINLSRFTCSLDTIWSCNVTGLWDKFDSHVEALCGGSDYRVYDETGAIFANVFCLMCNKPTGHKRPQQCPTRRKQDKPTFGPSYRLILDKNPDISSKDDDKNRIEAGCNTLQVFDQYLGRCRELQCPFQRLPDKGSCKRRQFAANNRLFPVVIKIILLAPVATNSTKLSTGGLYSTFLKALNLTDNTICQIQKTSLISFSNSLHRSVEYLLLRLSLRSSPVCNEEWIADFINSKLTPIDKQVNIESVNVPITMESSLKQDLADASYIMTPVFSDGEHCAECYHVTIGRLICPHVKLSKSEYCQIQKRFYDSSFSKCLSEALSVDDNFAADKNVENGIPVDILYICWSDYVKLADKLNDKSVENSGRKLFNVHLFLSMYIFVPAILQLLCGYFI